MSKTAEHITLQAEQIRTSRQLGFTEFLLALAAPCCQRMHTRTDSCTSTTASRNEPFHLQGNKQDRRRNITSMRASSPSRVDRVGSPFGRRRGPKLRDIEDQPVRGVFVALLNLFDFDGSGALTKEEFNLCASALGFDTSPSAWTTVANRFFNPTSPHKGKAESPFPEKVQAEVADSLDLTLIADHFANKYDAVMIEVLRNMMAGIVSLTSRVAGPPS